ncbi:hypothetical protein [Novosphingobium sp.]|uniref:hypothetical protein n=1 Tax=Novosphingobium sp. TaxID=1874826 RepID=UPI003B520113
MSTLTLPPSVSNRLDAVNVLLQAIGESPVNSIDTSEAVDVSAASQCLDEFDRAVQMRGWWWNKEIDLTLTPSSDGTIPLPTNCLSIVKAYPSGDAALIVERGRQLYDMTNHTYIFALPVQVDMVLRLDWEEMPEVMRRYITIWAAQQYQGRIQTSQGVGQILDSAVDEARAECGHKEDEVQESNSITGNASVAFRLNGRLRRRQN